MVAQLSTEQQWRHPPLNYRDSGSQHGFLHENWMIELEQLHFMIGPDGCPAPPPPPPPPFPLLYYTHFICFPLVRMLGVHRCFCTLNP